MSNLTEKLAAVDAAEIAEREARAAVAQALDGGAEAIRPLVAAARPKAGIGDVAHLLTERGKVHGEFRDHARVTQNLKNVLHQERGWDKLAPMQREALEMIMHKIGCIMAGDANHVDHWFDIAGYATLVKERLP